jgi:hypothetical protein
MTTCPLTYSTDNYDNCIRCEYEALHDGKCGRPGLDPVHVATPAAQNGLDIGGAMAALKVGRMVRRVEWPRGWWLHFASLEGWLNLSGRENGIGLDDLLATDWQAFG